MSISSRPFIHSHTTELLSTQLYAKDNLSSLNPSTNYLFTCDMQHNGLGTFGKPWYSLSTKNFYGTFALSLQKSSFSPLCLPQILAVCIAELLLKHAIKVQIKWPNDLMIDHKKVGGILAELITVHSTSWMLLGLGLNFVIEAYDGHAIDQPFTSLSEASDCALSKEDFTKELSSLFFSSLDSFFSEGFSSFLPRYKSAMKYFNKPVFKESSYIGLSHDITEEGSLIILTPLNSYLTIHSGSIKHAS